MPLRENAYLRHQQQRFMRPDAARYLRPDAARFLRPGTDPRDVYPALSRKYAGQPRIPGGEDGAGQFTFGRRSEADDSSDRPRVIIDTTNLDAVATGDEGGGDADSGSTSSTSDISSEADPLGLFAIKPQERRTEDRVRLAGDAPEQLPPIFVTPEPLEPGEPSLPAASDSASPGVEDPPEIPKQSTGGMNFARAVVRWLGIVGRYSIIGDAFLQALDQADNIKRLTDAIKSADDPPDTQKNLQDRTKLPSEGGYEDHHIVNRHDGNRKKFGDKDQ